MRSFGVSASWTVALHASHRDDPHNAMQCAGAGHSNVPPKKTYNACSTRARAQSDRPMILINLSSMSSQTISPTISILEFLGY